MVKIFGEWMGKREYKIAVMLSVPGTGKEAT